MVSTMMVTKELADIGVLVNGALLCLVLAMPNGEEADYRRDVKQRLMAMYGIQLACYAVLWYCAEW